MSTYSRDVDHDQPTQPDPDDLELRESLARYWSIIAAVADPVLVVAERRILEANPSARMRFGEQVTDRRLEDLVAAEHVLVVRERVRRARGGELVEPVACRLLALDGARPGTDAAVEFDAEVSAIPVRAGGMRAAAVIVRAGAPAPSAHAGSWTAQPGLDALLEALPCGTIVLGPARVEHVNRAMAELLGIDAATLVGRDLDTLRGALPHQFADPAAFFAFLESSQRFPADEHRTVLELAARAGSTIEFVAVPVDTLEGPGHLISAADVTRYRETERSLVTDAAAAGRARERLQRALEEQQEQARELGQRIAELESVNRQLVEIDAARAESLAQITHELQTPLVAVRGYCQMLEGGRLGPLSEGQRGAVEAAIRGVDRMVALVRGLLALARSERATPAEPEPVDTAEIVQDVFSAHAESARQHEVRLDFESEGPPQGLLVLAEREGLAQVLDNLVANAVKFNQAGGRVLVTVRPGPADFVKIEVADTGIGIPADEQARVFERLYRGRAASCLPGAGIGLATVRNIVRRHRGAIELESVEGQGTLFRLLWPRATSNPVSQVAL